MIPDDDGEWIPKHEQNRIEQFVAWDSILRGAPGEHREIAVWHALMVLYPHIPSGGVSALEQASIKGTFADFFTRCVEVAGPDRLKWVRTDWVSDLTDIKRFGCISIEHQDFLQKLYQLRNWIWETQRQPGTDQNDALITKYQWEVFEEKLQVLCPKR